MEKRTDLFHLPKVDRALLALTELRMKAEASGEATLADLNTAVLHCAILEQQGDADSLKRMMLLALRDAG